MEAVVELDGGNKAAEPLTRLRFYICKHEAAVHF